MKHILRHPAVNALGIGFVYNLLCCDIFYNGWQSEIYQITVTLWAYRTKL